MKYLSFAFFFAILILIIFVFWASSSSLETGISSQKFESTKDEIEKIENLKIMSWNLGFAYGVGSEGNGFERPSVETMKSRLDLAISVIKKYDPEIILIQEIDFDSSRSQNINQLEYIANKLGYKNYAYAVSWDKNYLPFPYFPIKNQWGKMYSGGAVLSKFPVKENKVHLYEHPESNAFWYNWFYLYRYSQIVKIEINNKDYNIINNHIEAFDSKTRMMQANKLSEFIDEINQKGEEILVVGGDFNTTPPNASRKDNFKDLGTNSYLDDTTYDLVAKFSNLKEVVDLNEYLQDEKRWFTFSSDNPDRRLDYLFIGNDFEVIATEIDHNEVSDHFPIISTLEIKAN